MSSLRKGYIENERVEMISGFCHVRTAWKLTVFGVFLVRILLHSNLKRTKKLRIGTLFTQWHRLWFNHMWSKRLVISQRYNKISLAGHPKEKCKKLFFNVLSYCLYFLVSSLYALRTFLRNPHCNSLIFLLVNFHLSDIFVRFFVKTNNLTSNLIQGEYMKKF